MASPTTVQCYDDSHVRSDGIAYTDTLNYQWFYNHTSTLLSNNWTSGMIFDVPTTIDPATITNVTLNYTSLNYTGSFAVKLCVQDDAPDWTSGSGTTDGHPEARRAAAITANGGPQTVTLDFTTSSEESSPDISARVVAALNNCTADSQRAGYYTIAVIVTGQRDGTGPIAGSQVATLEHSTATETSLTITYTEGASETLTPESFGATTNTLSLAEDDDFETRLTVAGYGVLFTDMPSWDTGVELSSSGGSPPAEVTLTPSFPADSNVLNLFLNPVDPPLQQRTFAPSAHSITLSTTSSPTFEAEAPYNPTPGNKARIIDHPGITDHPTI